MFQHTKTVARLLKVKKSNLSVYSIILDCVTARINKQGRGCYDEMGSTYCNTLNNTKCSIGILTTFFPKQLKHFSGLISDESQKKLVKNISNKFGVNVETGTEYIRFVEFLQHIQDAHDLAFDPFNNKESDHVRMVIFNKSIDNIKLEYKL